MGCEDTSTVSGMGLSAASVTAECTAAVVPPGLRPEEENRAREGAEVFLGLLLRHLDGDAAALAEIQGMLHAVARSVVEAGDAAGQLLDRFDAGRHVLIRALLESGVSSEQATDADDRLRLAQAALRSAIRDAETGYEAIIDGAVATVTRAIESGAAPEQAIHVAAASLCGLIDADRS